MNARRYFTTSASLTLLLTAWPAAAQDTITDVDATAPDQRVIPVAEPGPPAEEPTTVQPSDDQLLYEEFERFKMLVASDALDEADTAAKKIIEIAIRSKGARSNEMAKALTNLAIVQHRTRQFDAAQQNYVTAIEIIEDNEDRLNEQLVNPLQGLAAAQLEAGRPDLAVNTYNRALHVTHVNEGPHNLEQVGILDSLSEVNLRVGDFDAAKELQDKIYALNVRAVDVDTLALIPVLLRRANWQHRAGFIYDERATYRRILRIIETERGRNDISLVEPLIMLGNSFYYIDTSGQGVYPGTAMSTGEIYFKRALRIATNNADSNWRIKSGATLSLADYHMFQGTPQRARQVYRDAWDLLSSEEDSGERLDVRHRELESLVPLRERPIRQFVGQADADAEDTDDAELLQGTITVSFDISSAGRVENLKLVEASPQEFVGMQSEVRQEVRRRLYRPRFIDAEPVATTGQVFAHNFFYRQADLDEARREIADAASEDDQS
jgi:tetratricopeptide (TPR) repeat protein